MLRTPKSFLRTGRGVRASTTIGVFKAARHYFVTTGENEIAADKLALTAVRQLRRGYKLYDCNDTDVATLILSRTNLEYIANARDIL